MNSPQDSKTAKAVLVYSDGACSGNPGPGGWAAILKYGEHVREISGGQGHTTNNQMELTAAVEALRALKDRCQVQFFTDSEYVRQGITDWIKRWKSNGWRTASKKPVQNRSLWEALDAEASRHDIEWRWLRGHSGHPENERCDELARAEIDRLR